MSLESIIEVTSWVVMVILLLIFVPKTKFRDAQVIFLFHQTMTWFLGILVVELRWLEYPVRFLAFAIRTSFTFEFFVFPALAILFILKYPVAKGRLGRITYAVAFTTILTIFEVVLEKYTDLIEYHEWTWYWTWIAILVTFYVSRKYYNWFFKNRFN
ncbi:CBO0543 family protein [Ammoniphilus sp. YIM 78166]|uniref:CBO0543 family protein n=1 Tax=Ammoniphilus sp. YIM 78166 TaxID=1644106 RepID=UPI0010704AE3|nr:CBO0543 family protein [Ammoniphilus sp. YIM 78166]